MENPFANFFLPICNPYNDAVGWHYDKAQTRSLHFQLIG